MKQTSFEDKMADVNRDLYDQQMANYTLPKRGICIVDDNTAIMDQEYFDELLDYSLTMPTGVFVGKRWKANLYFMPAWECPKCKGKFVGWNTRPCPDCLDFDELIAFDRGTKWVMRSYEQHEDPNLVRNVQREIIVI